MTDVSINLVDDLEANYCNAIGRHQITVVSKQQLVKIKKRKQRRELFTLHDNTKVVKKNQVFWRENFALLTGANKFLLKN